MKFGKLDDITGIDFRLPSDHPATTKLLSGTPREPFEIYAGGTMWNIPRWKGKIYPPKTPAKEMIRFYCEQFGTIELNATHYRIHPPSTIETWKNAAPKDFKFCPKFPQLITHYRRFNNCEGLTDEFLEAILTFEDRLGPCFIQLPPNFTPREGEKMINYLRQWPNEVQLAVEFRHPAWFEQRHESEAVWTYLAERGIGAVITDTAGRRDAVHMRMTAPFLLLRFGGYEGHATDQARLDDWIERLSQWKQGGLEAVYLLMHQPDSIYTPESCMVFAEKVKRALHLDVKSPQLIQKQSLF